MISWSRTSIFISLLSLVAFKLYDRDGNGVLDSSVSSSAWVNSHESLLYPTHLIVNRMSHITKQRCVGCEQEVDRIIAQMMHAAEYLGWDVSELRPVSAQPSALFTHASLHFDLCRPKLLVCTVTLSFGIYGHTRYSFARVGKMISYSAPIKSANFHS